MVSILSSSAGGWGGGSSTILRTCIVLAPGLVSADTARATHSDIDGDVAFTEFTDARSHWNGWQHWADVDAGGSSTYQAIHGHLLEFRTRTFRSEAIAGYRTQVRMLIRPGMTPEPGRNAAATSVTATHLEFDYPGQAGGARSFLFICASHGPRTSPGSTRSSSGSRSP